MNPILFEIGPLTLRWYGMMIALAVAVGVWLAGKEGARKGFDFVIFLILWKFRKRHFFDGFLFLLYILLYSSVRIFVEHFRADKLIFFGNISAAQTIGLVGIILSLGLLIILSRKEVRK